MNYEPFERMLCLRGHGEYLGKKGESTPCRTCAAEDARLEAIIERVVRRVLSEQSTVKT